MHKYTKIKHININTSISKKSFNYEKDVEEMLGLKLFCML